MQLAAPLGTPIESISWGLPRCSCPNIGQYTRLDELVGDSGFRPRHGVRYPTDYKLSDHQPGSELRWHVPPGSGLSLGFNQAKSELVRPGVDPVWWTVCR